MKFQITEYALLQTKYDTLYFIPNLVTENDNAQYYLYNIQIISPWQIGRIKVTIISDKMWYKRL